MTKEIKIIKKKGGLMNRILARLHVFLSETLMTFFFSHHPFLRFSAFPYFCILQMMNPIHIFCTLYTPYIPTHMLFSHVCTLLCALVTVDTAYTIYFFLIHHCTNILSSLHILVHHCTFCASLHTKTSPDRKWQHHFYNSHRLNGVGLCSRFGLRAAWPFRPYTQAHSSHRPIFIARKRKRSI